MHALNDHPPLTPPVKGGEGLSRVGLRADQNQADKEALPEVYPWQEDLVIMDLARIQKNSDHPPLTPPVV